MKKNLFEMGVDWNDGWSSDNKDKPNNTAATEIKPPSRHHLQYSKEKRRGKIVTIVQPFYLEKTDLKSLLKEIKKKLGTGGTVKSHTLELQGNVEDQVHEILTQLNYK